MRRRIDLNADLGEGFGAWARGPDEELLACVSSANVACGFHAGDPRGIDRVVALAARAGVALGAHPGHHDLRGFGRREIAAEPAEIEADVVYQVGAVAAFARSHGVSLAHVKPHGALYNQAARDEALARAVARGVARCGRELALVGPAGCAPLRAAAAEEGLRFVAEAFVDRAYDARGRLVPRTQPGALIADPAEATRRALSLALEGRVVAIDGTSLALEAETLCVHGDGPSALVLARAVRAALEGAGVAVLAPAR